MSLEMLFGGFLLMIVVWIAFEMRFPRKTDDIYWPDVKRRAQKQAAKDAWEAYKNR